MKLRRPTRVASAAALASALVLSACTGGSSDPGPTGTTPPSTSATPPPTSSTSQIPTTTTPIHATTTSSGPDFPKGVPEAAQKQTPEGAKAFAKYFVSIFNDAWTRPDPDLLRPLCLDRFEACGAYLKTAADLKAKGHRYDGDPLTASSFTVLARESSRTPVLMVGFQEKRNVVSQGGSIVLTDPRESLRIVYALSWNDRGWQVYSSKLVS